MIKWNFEKDGVKAFFVTVWNYWNRHFVSVSTTVWNNNFLKLFELIGISISDSQYLNCNNITIKFTKFLWSPPPKKYLTRPLWPRSRSTAWNRWTADPIFVPSESGKIHFDVGKVGTWSFSSKTRILSWASPTSGVGDPPSVATTVKT